MMRTTFLVILVASATVGCKGETVVQPDQHVVSDLEACKNSLTEKDKRIAQLQEENAELMKGKGKAEIVVVIEGNALTVKPPIAGSAPPPVDDKVAAAASKEFLNVVAKSRGAIQKCYEQALKKGAASQAKTITLTVEASFTNSGQFRESTFNPSLGDAFDSCIKTVSSKWQLPQNSPAMTFKAQVSLTPS
jgi:hypothetical protein